MENLTLNSITNWSPEQTAIFDWAAGGTGNLIVRARAGTGKTTTIREMFAKAPEKRMLYCVFNKKNQLEAAAKIKDIRVEVKTLHSVGFAFIKKVWPKSRPENDVEFSRIDAVIYREKGNVKNAVRKLVGFAKNILINPTLDDLTDLCFERGIDCEDTSWTEARIAGVALQVLELSKIPDNQNRISFDDMVWLPVAMNWVRPSYDLVVVDESQDMNLPQLYMAKGSSSGRVCVVGDDRQAIYHFRGAASDGMDLMKQELSAQELGLTTTYRCPKNVVALAATMVPDYKADESAPDGVVDNMDNAGVLLNAKPGNAILSRLNAPLMPLCLRFIRNGVAAKIEGRDIGKALVAIVDKIRAADVPEFMTKTEEWRNKTISRVIKTKNGDRKAGEIDDQADTLLAVAEGAESVRDIKNRLENLFVDTNGSTNSVLLSSTHKAKGLEWDRVFILRDTYNKRPATTPEGAREEQNIYYVAITRAKKHLTMVSA